MKRTRHSEAEMVKVVHQLGSKVSAELVTREHGVSQTTLPKYKSIYSGMVVSQV